jgi:glucose/arabinose dehydrogenase
VLGNSIGKILRMTDEGKVPPDNPFVGRPGADPYIWSYGHRVPTGLAFDAHGQLWEAENGPRGGDEVNHIRKGRN